LAFVASIASRNEQWAGSHVPSSASSGEVTVKVAGVGAATVVVSTASLSVPSGSGWADVTVAVPEAIPAAPASRSRSTCSTAPLDSWPMGQLTVDPLAVQLRGGPNPMLPPPNVAPAGRSTSTTTSEAVVGPSLRTPIV
jgi:hypothetical protein